MSLKSNVAATWKGIAPWTKVSAVWKRGLLWTNVAGVWKRISISAALVTGSYSTSATSANTCRFEIRTDGYIWSSNPSGSSMVQRYLWNTSGSPGADFQAVVSNVTGTFTAGAAGTYNLATQRAWTRNSGSSAGSGLTVSFDLSIQAAADGSVLAAPVRVTLNAFFDV